MDLQRDPAILRRKKRRQAIAASVAAVVIVGLSVAVSRLEPAAPGIASADTTLWYGTVRRGPMVREVRGSGTLTPEEIRWIPASASGRVERIVLQPGATVQPGTVILELSNPDLVQSVKNAEMDWKTAVAQLGNQRASLTNARLTQEAAVSDAFGAYQLSVADVEMHQKLFDAGGLVPALLLKQKQVARDQAKNRWELAKRQLDTSMATSDLQLAPAEAAGGDGRHVVACLLPPQTRRALWAELQQGSTPEEAKERVTVPDDAVDPEVAAVDTEAAR